MGGGGSQTQTTKSEPWSGQQPYLTKGFSEAEKLYNQGPQSFFPGQTYTDMDPARQSALQGTIGEAGNSNNVVNAATGYAQNTLGGQSDNPYAALLGSGASGMMDTASGQYLNNNPFLDDIYGSAADKATDEWSTTIMPGIAAQFGGSGGAGSTMHSELATRAGGELSDTLGQLKSSIYGGNYQQERDRQTSAQGNLASLGTNLYGTGVNERLGLTGQAAGLRDAQFGDFDRAAEAGKAFEEQQGKEIQGDIDRWNFEQNAEQSALQDYMSMIMGNYGSTSTTRGGSSGSGLATGLGAVMSIASMFSDVRLKTGIRHIATTAEGVKLYSFRYTRKARAMYDLPAGAQIGVLAQEVQATHPHVVHKAKGGHLKVDYGALFKQYTDGELEAA